MGWLAALTAVVGFAPRIARSEDDKLPPAARDIGVDQKIGADIPLDARFVDSDGREVSLKQFFDGKTPIILTLNYYECPMLCTLQLEDLVKTLQLSKMEPGKDFRVLTVSFNHLETPQQAKLKRDAYLARYAHPRGANGWGFLVGPKSSIARLTEAVGFKFKWVEQNQEYSHAATLILCTPDGKVSRYLGLNTEPKVLRLSLVEASNGKTGTLFDQLFLFCYHYDPAANSYAAVAMNIMRLGGVATLLALAVFGLGLWMYELRRRRHLSPAVEGAA